MPKAKVTTLARTLQILFNERAETLARDLGVIRRRRTLSGSGLAKTLVFGWLAKPQATLENLAQHAAALGQAITPQGLDLRFTETTAQWLRRLLEEALSHLVEARPAAQAFLARFPGGVFLLDCSQVRLPEALARLFDGGAGRAAAKLDVCWNFTTGALVHLGLGPARRHDRASAGQARRLPRGALRLADLGYFTLSRLRALGQEGVFWLSRLRAGTAVCRRDGTRLDLASWLDEQARGGGGVEVDEVVLVGAAERLPCRLLAARLPEAVSAERRRRLRQEARRRGQSVSRWRLRLADWRLLITNAPAERLGLEEALVAYGLRWQIELLFKLWKQHGGLDRWRTQKPWRILCEFYAKLLAMLVLHWALLVGCWHRVDRSLVKAAQTVQSHAVHVMLTLARHARLVEALTILAATLGVGSGISKRGSPATYQRVLALTENRLT